MTATIEIEAGQIWEADGRLFHVDSVDEEGARIGLAYAQKDGRYLLVEATETWAEFAFVGAILVRQS